MSGLVAAISRKEHVVTAQTDFLGSPSEVRKASDEFRKLVESAAGKPWTDEQAKRFRAVSHRLYTAVIGPVRDNLKTRRLVVMPSRDLYEIPFALLVDDQGRMLGEQFVISYTPSATTLKFCLDGHKALGDRILVLANPALSDPAFRLKFAEQEAEAIRQVYPGARLFMGSEATETALLAAMNATDIIHLACHGMNDPKDPMASFLALAPDAKSDGRLTTARMLELDTSAQLVVLSACETGRGALFSGSEELVGMLRSWLLAGAPSVVVSLWKLDDRATSELMAEFYKNLRTMSRSEALQQAQLVMMRKYENPYYWGAFVLYGDYR